jgi:hypothetical protein
VNAIGCWHGGGLRGMPRPQWFLRPGWQADDRDRMLTLLRSGLQRGW